MTGAPPRPRPAPTEWDLGYWDAASRGELVVQACAACGTVRSLPRLGCGACGGLEHTWLAASGRATLESWTILRRSFHPGFADLPILVVVVELDDHPGVRLVSNLVGIGQAVLLDPLRAKGLLRIGAAVHVEFVEIDGSTLPQFALSDPPERSTG